MIDYKMLKNLGGFFLDRRRISPDFAMQEVHFHPYYELYYMVSGSCNTFINHTLHHVSAGDLVLIKDMDIHRTLNYSRGMNDRIVIYFSREFIRRLYEECGQELVDSIFTNPQISVPANRREYVEYLFKMLAYEYDKKDTFNQLLRRNHVYELLMFYYHCNQYQIEKEPKEDFGEARIQAAAKYMCENFSLDLTLEETAAFIGMSPTYFSKKFKKITGLGFKEYLTQIRIREASVLLLETEESVTKIANQCGFNDSNYFSEVFKKIKGISPKQYRKTPKAV